MYRTDDFYYQILSHKHVSSFVINLGNGISCILRVIAEWSGREPTVVATVESTQNPIIIILYGIINLFINQMKFIQPFQ